mmetsp:Transcript_30859/g.86503  ORF Transcript_30859/g.86503 Transcript_30859/m.86503 type:complete len:304 (+) Transcript_30859:83-994(+)
MAVKGSKGTVSFAYRDLAFLDPDFVEENAKHVVMLDLSNNRFNDLLLLDKFQNLESLVLDNNRISSLVKFPTLEKLKTLSVNKNNISNLAAFITQVQKSCPSLTFLSMLQNEACPNFFNGGTPQQYRDYRHYVISRLPGLHTLDSSPVTNEERATAKMKYAQKFELESQPRSAEDGKRVRSRSAKKGTAVRRRKPASSSSRSVATQSRSPPAAAASTPAGPPPLSGKDLDSVELEKLADIDLSGLPVVEEDEPPAPPPAPAPTSRIVKSGDSDWTDDDNIEVDDDSDWSDASDTHGPLAPSAL